MNSYRADLHVHTVLSPCAEIEMLPPLIVMEALERGIQILAITDHNGSANIQAVQEATRGTSLTIMPGMEVQTREDVHVLCIFDTDAQVQAMQEFVDKRLPDMQNQPDHFGDQLVVDARGDFIRREERLLLHAIDASIEQVCDEAHRLGGLFIPAHVDRQAYGLIGALGFLPAGLTMDAVEVSRHVDLRVAHQKFPQLRGCTVIQNGDAHRLNEMLGSLILRIEQPTVEEICLALQNHCGRSHTQTALNGVL